MVIAIKTRAEQTSFLDSAIAKIMCLDDNVMSVFQDIGDSGYPLADTAKVKIAGVCTRISIT
jgi:hypothetical protein